MTPQLLRPLSAQPSTTAPLEPRAANPSVYRRLILGLLSPLTRGHLQVELPGGEVRHFGGAQSVSTISLPLGIPTSAVLRIHREGFFKKCVLFGDIGFADSYLDGDWDTPDLTALVAWFIHNLDHAPTLSGSRHNRVPKVKWLGIISRLGHLLRPNTRKTARRNIAEHYDLSNEFFSLFLDPTLMYSSAKWVRPEQTLEEAQHEKNEALCRSLRLCQSDHVLEIGTGWGGWSLHAAKNYGCRVTSVTISREQFNLARQRVAAAGLSSRIDVQFRDYRELTGQYDKLVSIEMLEAVGHRYHSTFAEICSRVLKPEGLLALQFITCPDHRYNQLRRGVDFIQRHIFPGSLLLSLNRVNALLSRHGGFMLHEVSDLGHDYARTLKYWHQAFRQRLPEVRELGFDDRFIRKWEYYLCYCEAAFALRNISVVQTLHTRPNNLGLRRGGGMTSEQ